MGFYLPTMNKDVHEYMRGCSCQMGENPIVLNCTNLYKMKPFAPKWAKAMVEYMSTKVMPKKMSKVRQRYLQKHAQDYWIIDNHLYHHGKDLSLRFCVTKAEYLEVFFHAHSCFLRGHFSTDVTARAITRQDFGGQHYSETQQSMFGDAMNAKGIRLQYEGTKCPWDWMDARAFAKWEIDFVRPIDTLAHRTHA